MVPPPGFAGLSEPVDPDERRQWIRQQISEDAKSPSEAARVLSTDFVQISSATHKRWRQMRDRQMEGVACL